MSCNLLLFIQLWLAPSGALHRRRRMATCFQAVLGAREIKNSFVSSSLCFLTHCSNMSLFEAYINAHFI
ncbi:hypothetical protein V5799_008869 [Amblyomma americanum]|uniref:Secreted protein n=1 Tax=Amblyomma americanum TaxID=6943 RepID=A0AAQ4FDS1_AMBAM